MTCNCTLPIGSCEKCHLNNTSASYTRLTSPDTLYVPYQREKDARKERIRKLNELVKKWR